MHDDMMMKSMIMTRVWLCRCILVRGRGRGEGRGREGIGL